LFHISEIAGEVQLRTYGQFLDEYGAQLKGIEEALEDSACDSWDISLNPISLQVNNCTFLFQVPIFRITHPTVLLSDNFMKIVLNV
jgi:hypothetical protein